MVVRKCDAHIVLDGRLDDEQWKHADSISGFERNFPDDHSLAAYTTMVKLMYNSETLFIGAHLKRNALRPYSVSTLKEDFVLYENDFFGIVIDPFSDRTNGYGFYVNAFGARRDEQISAGSVSDPILDIKWDAEVFRQDEYYIVEVAIPLKYIRHGHNKTWNINFVRNDMGANERTSWVRTPINFLLGNLAFFGTLHWDADMSVKNKLYSVIPSLASTIEKEKGKNINGNLTPSLDTKIALSTSLNIDATVNPDFSQAEVDKVQVNLTRFELAFPENRFFFVENSDLFSGFGDDSWGNPANRPFYSRKIGLKFDTATSSYAPTSIIGGARVSGKINSNLRFGGMTLFSKADRIGDKYSPSQNYLVLAVQQKVFTRSSLAVMLINRQAFGNDSTSEFAINKKDFNRTVALEYNFATPDDKYNGKLYRHFMIDHQNGNSEYAQGFLLRQNTPRWKNWFQITQITSRFQPDVGFVPRTNVLNVNVQGSYNWYPKKSKINQFEVVANPQFFLTANGKYSDHTIISGGHLITKKTEEVWLVHVQERITLKAPFNPVFTEGSSLDSGVVSTYNFVRFYYGADRRQPFFWETNVDVGQYFSGTQIKMDGMMSYRIQPYGIIGVNFNVSRFSLPYPFGSNAVYYFGPRAEIAFNRKIFLTSVVQYASMAENLNYYARFQWRFRPLSDLFLVYSANQDTQLNYTKNHNLILKVVLWL
jgi:hypothetical protein